MKFLLYTISRGLVTHLLLAAICLAALDMLGVAVVFPYLSVLTAEAPDESEGLLAGVYRWTGAESRQEFLIIVSLALAAFFVAKFTITCLANVVKYRTNA